MEPNRKIKVKLIREVSNFGFNFIVIMVLGILVDNYFFKNGIAIIIAFFLAILRSAFSIYLLIKVSNND
ncbi:MAG: hypothetical protein ACRCTA_06225 [Bacilli bacterium]